MTTFEDLPAGSQRELRSSWHTLLSPLGFSARSLWLTFVDDRRRLRPQVLEVADLPDEATPGDAAQIEHFLEGFASSGHRLAALVSRPGRATLTAGDRSWAAVLYDACWAVGLASSTVHIAGDDDIVPVPLDEVADLLDRLAS